MKFIYVLEDDARIQKDLFEALKIIDPALGIRFFPTLAQFHEWLKLALVKGPLALGEGGARLEDDTEEAPAPSDKDILVLVVAKDELLGTRNMDLIKRARDFFLRKKICSAEDPTALVLTAFDSVDFHIKLAEERIINNVIFKPFDKLILRQDLEYALTGHHPMSNATVANMQIKATIEMLKEVIPNTLTEIGFTSLNDSPIKIGALSKYYSEAFAFKNKKSILAYCHACNETSPGKYTCEFHFLGADNMQISQIRRHILQDKTHVSQEYKRSSGPTQAFIILDENAVVSADLKSVLNEKFDNINVFTYSSYGQLLSDLADKDTTHRQELPVKIDGIIASHAMFEVEKEKQWEGLCQVLKDRGKAHETLVTENPSLFLLDAKEQSFDVLKSYAAWGVKEFFYLPLERSYIVKRLSFIKPELRSKEKVTVSSLAMTNILKVANPVETIEVSEAGMILKYHRSLEIGSFREFIMWLPNEADIPEIIANCNFTEPNKGGEGFTNHFVFFGMKDHYLKHIRLWMREAYIKQKGTEEAS